MSGTVDEGIDLSSVDAENRSRIWRTMLGEYPTGVAIITSIDEDGSPVGMVVGTFSSISMDPPLVGFMPARTSTTYPAIARAGHFCVSVLGAGHEDLCRAFFSSKENRFEGDAWIVNAAGVPRLRDSVVWFDCDLTHEVDAGDHLLVLGGVTRLGTGDGTAGMPLLFLKGGYGSFTVPRLQFDADRFGSRLRIAAGVQDAVQRLSEDLGAECTLATVEQGSVVILTAANIKAQHRATDAIGATFPFAAPLAPVFAAWGTEDRIKEWESAARRLLGDVDQEFLTAMLDDVRSRGYSVSLGRAMAESFVAIVGGSGKNNDSLSSLWSEVAREYRELRAGDDWAAHVSSVQLPVFNEAGVAEMSLVVSDLPLGMSADDLSEVVERTRLVATELTRLVSKQAAAG